MKKFANDTHIKIIQGDSSLVLRSLLPTSNGAVLFWLDGHYSSEFVYNGEFIRTAKGIKDTPIDEELNIIMQSSIEPIILIDDARLFNGKNCYPTFKAVKEKVKSFNNYFDVFINKDIIHIIPKNK